MWVFRAGAPLLTKNARTEAAALAGRSLSVPITENLSLALRLGAHQDKIVIESLDLTRKGKRLFRVGGIEKQKSYGSLAHPTSLTLGEIAKKIAGNIWFPQSWRQKHAKDLENPEVGRAVSLLGGNPGAVAEGLLEGDLRPLFALARLGEL